VLAAGLLRPSSFIEAPEIRQARVEDTSLRTSTVHPIRLLPDGTPLHNRLLAALPAVDYARIQKLLHMNTGVTGRTLQAHGTAVTDVCFPNGCVFSVTNEMRDGALVEVATVGIEGMLGIGYFSAIGRARAARCSRCPMVPSLNDRAPLRQRERGTRTVSGHPSVVRAGPNLLQIMQGTACNALHGVKQRCCRWLLQTQDRVGSSEFLLKQDFLAIMLGVQRPTVTLVRETLQDAGLIATTYGRIRVLKRRRLERASCECYEVIRAHFQRLGL
jgi:Crp-like helix-turn-helix protein